MTASYVNIQPAQWCADYIGTEYKDHGRDKASGYDCWGLVRDVMQQVFGRCLPDYGEAYATGLNRTDVARAVEAGLTDGWRKLDLSSPSADETPREGDLVILRLAGRPWHCAIAAGGDWMMHAIAGAGVVLEHWTLEPWKNRVEGFYRHE
jgi:cell wall-associated NlpC family hydrolase